MIVVSIDPGMSGALARIGIDGSSSVCDLAVVDNGIDKWIDGRVLYDQLLEWVPVTERCILIVEDVRVRAQGNGGRAMNTMHSQTMLMRTRGIIEGVAMVARFPITWVTPQKWKRHFSLAREEDETTGQVKEKSRQMALKLFPGMAPALARMKDQNRAEALLMAHWGRSTQL